MPRHETQCAALDLPTPCTLTFRWTSFDTAEVDPTGVSPEVLGPIRQAGWECVLGSWFCSLHKATGARLVVAQVKERQSVLVGGGSDGTDLQEAGSAGPAGVQPQ